MGSTQFDEESRFASGRVLRTSPERSRSTRRKSLKIRKASAAFDQLDFFKLFSRAENPPFWSFPVAALGGEPALSSESKGQRGMCIFQQPATDDQS